jgi:hypothetical protein
MMTTRPRPGPACEGCRASAYRSEAPQLPDAPVDMRLARVVTPRSHHRQLASSSSIGRSPPAPKTPNSPKGARSSLG